jgi:hypothetical protein
VASHITLSWSLRLITAHLLFSSRREQRHSHVASLCPTDKPACPLTKMDNRGGNPPTKMKMHRLHFLLLCNKLDPRGPILLQFWGSEICNERDWKECLFPEAPRGHCFTRLFLLLKAASAWVVCSHITSVSAWSSPCLSLISSLPPMRTPWRHQSHLGNLEKLLQKFFLPGKA